MNAIAALPKVELHLHIEGTLEPELIFELAARNKIGLPYSGLNELRARYQFTDLQSFLDLYYANMAVLRTADDFADLMQAYLRRATAGGVRHAEVFFDPQAHLVRGVPLAEVVDGLVAGSLVGAAETGTTASLIACFLRDRDPDEALDVLKQLIAIDAPIIGIGLDSAEVGNPASKFTAVFQRAGELGLRRVAHAGEEGGPEYVTDALDLLEIERVDHGVRAIEDVALIRRLVADRTPLTVCPVSNLRLGGVSSLADHVLPKLIEAGVVVTINSDDPAYFGAYLDGNYEAVATQFALSADGLADLAQNSVDASFLSPARKAELTVQIAQWRDANGHAGSGA